ADHSVVPPIEQERVGREYIIESIEYPLAKTVQGGYNRNGMGAYQFTDAQYLALIEYMKSISQYTDPEQPAMDEKSDWKTLMPEEEPSE
ncbi:MAG: hypothetical protein AAGD32_17975, partial [Planctomycetota bacterium]